MCVVARDHHRTDPLLVGDHRHRDGPRRLRRAGVGDRLAFSLGADLGTTITSFIASLNLSKNAKRAAYAHMSFNLIGVAVMLPLFPLATEVLKWFIGDPAVPTIVDGAETFPLVPVAVGIYSTAFNIFNTLLLFPFIGIFDRILSRIGHSAADDVEDYSTPRFLDPRHRDNLPQAVPAVQQRARPLSGSGGPVPGDRARLAVEAGQSAGALRRDRHPEPGDPVIHGGDVPERHALCRGRPGRQPDRGRPISAPAWAKRCTRSPAGWSGSPSPGSARTWSKPPSARSPTRCGSIAPEKPAVLAAPVQAATWLPGVVGLRERCLKAGAELSPVERGAVLALLGSAERAFVLIERIDAERRSVPRIRAAEAAAAQPSFAEVGRAVPQAI